MTYSWHQDFYENKVQPLINRHYGYEQGLFAWLETADKQAYDELTRLEQLINDVWLSMGEHDAFKKACREWYDAIITARGRWVAALGEDPQPPPAPVPEKQGKLI